jgi:hypothetical protein
LIAFLAGQGAELTKGHELTISDFSISYGAQSPRK